MNANSKINVSLNIFSLVAALLFANVASALDVSQCPDKIDMQIDVVRVYKTSIYSKTPGWKEARAALAGSNQINANFSKTVVTGSTCRYADANGHTATLSTVSFQDPEEREPSLSQQLRINLNIDGSTFVSYLPVKSYSVDGLEAYSRPYSLKVKTRLLYPQTRRWVSLDMGMVSITLN